MLDHRVVYKIHKLRVEKWSVEKIGVEEGYTYFDAREALDDYIGEQVKYDLIVAREVIITDYSKVHRAATQ